MMLREQIKELLPRLVEAVTDIKRGKLEKARVIEPRNTWKDAAAYDQKARELAKMFEKNFDENAAHASKEIKNAGPLSRYA